MVKEFLFPLNFGFKYNITGSWNLFSEVTYRFTNSDKIDYFSDVSYHIPKGASTIYQASTSGGDQYFSAKIGLSYNLLTVYGIEQKKQPKKKWLFFGKKGYDRPDRSNKRPLFGFLKRK